MDPPLPDVPDFIKSSELRKGPRSQDTLGWMNAVQSGLDDFTSWDRSASGTIYARVHKDKEFCMLARIALRTIEKGELKSAAEYYGNDLEPAICKLLRQEEKRQREISKSKDQDTVEAESDEQVKKEEESKKRKLDEDEEIHSSTKKAKQKLDQRLDGVIDSLHTLRRRVNDETGTNHVGLRRVFLKVEEEILDVMAAND